VVIIPLVCDRIQVAPNTFGVMTFDGSYFPPANETSLCPPPGATNTTGNYAHAYYQSFDTGVANKTCNETRGMWQAVPRVQWIFQKPCAPGVSVCEPFKGASQLTSSYSISLWLYPSSLTTYPLNQTIVVGSSDFGLAGSQWIMVHSFGGILRLVVGHTKNTLGGIGADIATNSYVPVQGVRDIIDPKPLFTDRWVHFVVTYNQDHTLMWLYRDGVQVSSLATSTLSWTGADSNLQIGGCFNSLLPNAEPSRFSGVLGDLAVYSIAVTPEVVAKLYDDPVF